jgi:hypothetical protein
MRRILSYTLLLVLTIQMSSLSMVTSAQETAKEAQSSQTVAPLTNKDVLEMLKAQLTAEIVIAKIKASASNFDTSPTALQELKTAGVPDTVILAMVQAATGAQTSVASPLTEGEPVSVKVPDGTEIEIQLTNTVSGQEAKVGDVVDFTVTHPVQINGITIIEKDASARARITTAKKSGYWGKAGKLEWAMQDIQAVDGNRIPARFTQRQVGDSKGGTVAVAAVATTVLLGPLGLLWGLKKGRPAIIPAANRYKIFVHGDTVVKAKRSPTRASQ